MGIYSTVLLTRSCAVDSLVELLGADNEYIFELTDGQLEDILFVLVGAMKGANFGIVEDDYDPPVLYVDKDGEEQRQHYYSHYIDFTHNFGR